MHTRTSTDTVIAGVMNVGTNPHQGLRWLHRAGVAIFCLLSAQCASMESADDSADQWDDEKPGAESEEDGDFDDDGDEADEESQTDWVDPNESEEEGDGAFMLPIVSGPYVFHLSPHSPRIAAIHSTSLQIQTIAVGHIPLEIAPVIQADPQAAAVCVLGRNDLLTEVAYVRLDTVGNASVELFSVVRGVNALVADPSGRFVFAYHDVDSSVSAGPGSDQELSVIDLSSGQVVHMSVGAHPREIQFSDDAQWAFVTTADGVSVIQFMALGEGGKQPLIPVVPAIGLDPERVEIKIDTFSGQAIARATDIEKIWVTDLSSGAQYAFDLPNVATDLDVAGNSLFAVIPGEPASQLAELQLPVTESSVVKMHEITDNYVGIGAYSMDGNAALLYTTLNPNDADKDDEDFQDPRRRLTLLRRNGADWQPQQTLFVEAPIREVGIAPDGSNAILLHEKAPELNADAPWPYTLLDIAAEFPIKKLQHTVAEPSSILFTPDGQRAAVVVPDDVRQLHSVEMVSLHSFVVQPYRLASRPQRPGYVYESDLVFISQEHSSGRISFIDRMGKIRTVTGFESDGGIKD